jgi:DNA-binding MltR family transcriptional regulator
MPPFPWPEELSPQTARLIKVLEHGDDLTCAIIGAAFVDHCLASLLQKYLTAGQTSVSLLQPASPLGPYSARRLLCYSLGLIDKALSLDLERIGTIRNQFAHRFFDLRFADEPVARLCNGLTALGFLEKLGEPLPPRDRFFATVVTVANRLLLTALSTEHCKKSEGATIVEPLTKKKPPGESESR